MGKKRTSEKMDGIDKMNKMEVALGAQYEFPKGGKKRVACKVQDDMGGEGLWTAEIEVT